MVDCLYLVEDLKMERVVMVCNRETLENFLHDKLNNEIADIKEFHKSVGEEIGNITKARIYLYNAMMENIEEMEITDIINELDNLEYKVEELTDKEDYIKAYESFEIENNMK